MIPLRAAESPSSPSQTTIPVSEIYGQGQHRRQTVIQLMVEKLEVNSDHEEISNSRWSRGVITVLNNTTQSKEEKLLLIRIAFV